MVIPSSRACWNCEKAEAFCAEAFQAACGNHQKEVAEGHLCRFPQLRQIQQVFFLFWSFFLSLWKSAEKCRARLAYRPRSAIVWNWSMADFCTRVGLRTYRRADAILP